MKEDEIKQFLKYYEKQSNVYMPNEIFDDLQSKFNLLNTKESKNEKQNTFVVTETINGIRRKKRGTNKSSASSHIAFAYSYIYFISWLYRYSKYGEIIIKTEEIKEILGYSKTSQAIDFIIKKNGVLDQLEYTETTSDYPVFWDMDSLKEMTFTLISEVDEYIKKDHLQTRGRNYKVKYPVKHFHRYEESYHEGDLDGIFYDISNTHLIPFEVFMFCMGNKDIGVMGFYLYGYIKRMNDFYGRGYDVSLPNLSHNTAIPSRTLDKYIDILWKHRMIKCIHNQEYFVPGLHEEERKANTYIANDYYSFSDTKLPVQKMKTLKLDQYEKLKGELENTPTEEEIEWGLPANM